MTEVRQPLVPESIPDTWPRLGNGFTRWLGRSVLRLFGWRVAGELPQTARLVMAGAPHTSNWDFVLAMAALLAMGVKVHWLAKHSIFKWPFRGLLTSLGGIPVNRGAAGGVVRQAVSQLRGSEPKVIGIAPEGTRSRVENWKMGFLRIAHQARVPIMPVGIDYKSKSFNLGELMETSGDMHADMAKIREHFRQFTGKIPTKAG